MYASTSHACSAVYIYTCVHARAMKLYTLAGHYHPHDPYAADDPNNGYPHHFCDLNEDEYGRPYMGPFDQYVQGSSLFPVIPPPRNYNATTSEFEPLTAEHKRRERHQVLSLPGCITSNECQLDRGIYRIYACYDTRCTDRKIETEVYTPWYSNKLKN